MNTLIVIGVLLMLASVVVMYRQWRKERSENSRLRNDLHATINARNAMMEECQTLRDGLYAAVRKKRKSRGITGRYRKAITEAVVEYDGCSAYDLPAPIVTIFEGLRHVLGSEAPNA